jgi:hypothetical protein
MAMNPVINPVIIKTEVKFRKPKRQDKRPATPLKLRKRAAWDEEAPLYCQDRELYDIARPIWEASWYNVRASHWESPIKFDRNKFYGELIAALEARGLQLEIMHSFGQATDIGWNLLDWIWLGTAPLVGQAAA